MNYKVYIEWKGAQDLNKYLRLDCMNPLISLKHITSNKKEAIVINEMTKYMSTGIGTLETINNISSIYPDRIVYIPKGVYPRYKSEVLRSEYHVEEMTNSIVVITSNFPGSNLDISKLLESNVVIVDGVYDYERICDKLTHKGDNFYFIRSTTKLQLKRDHVIIYHNNQELGNTLQMWNEDLELNISNEIKEKSKIVLEKLKESEVLVNNFNGYFMLLDIPVQELLYKSI